MPVTYDLRGRRALLTGVLGSLGKAQAHRLAEAGASLILLDHPARSDGDNFAAEVRGRWGVDVLYVGADIGVLDALPSLVSELEAGGPIDILINNAALIDNRPLEDVSIASYEEQLRVNAGAPFVLSQALAGPMGRRGYGKIVNLCSVTLNGRWSGYAPYVASKGALVGMTKALARELGPRGIRVNGISPGAVTSESEARVFGDKLEEYAAWVLDHQSLKERIEPEHIADAILFLASGASDMVTGAVLDVTAGW